MVHNAKNGYLEETTEFYETAQENILAPYAYTLVILISSPIRLVRFPNSPGSSADPNQQHAVFEMLIWKTPAESVFSCPILQSIILH